MNNYRDDPSSDSVRTHKRFQLTARAQRKKRIDIWKRMYKDFYQLDFLFYVFFTFTRWFASLLPRRRQRYRGGTRKLENSGFRIRKRNRTAALISRTKCDTISAIQLPWVPLFHSSFSLSLSLFLSFFVPLFPPFAYFCEDIQMRPSLLQFNARWNFLLNCKLSDHSAAGLMCTIAHSAVIVCSVNFRTGWQIETFRA